MGTSNWQNISYNIDIVKRLNPESVLDIGVGFGRWGFLFREFLEIWGDGNYSGTWSRVIDGVEIFPGYIKPYHKYFYNNIFIEDAAGFLKHTVNKYDLINCGDVIEHFKKEDAVELINLCLLKGKYVLINIPSGDNWKQGAINNNEFEMHRSVWDKSDFIKFENVLIKKFRDIELRDFLVVLISREKINLAESYGKYFNLKNIMRNKLGLKRLVSLIEKKNG